ncbi:hypothetical protein [Pseudonocardia endophytica]|uniref:Uncharacterized protein n=1 Tax=Pseudonocardia endophytica TaxID=401976 RepID=A0A4R1HZC8_PSEEN|nr:hypothetical protein [Pseudonocardia endophytica]TCK27778.1 hypothetical protein EV378_3657 [Pseudonocardia endophytica]
MPASTTPLRDYLDRSSPGSAGPDHLVVPRSLAESMPLRWQQVFAGMLADLHDAYADLPWPQYRVTAVRDEALTDLDDDQLAATGYQADLGPDGTLEYRGPDGRPVAEPERHQVLAPVRDPIPPVSAGRVEPRPAPRR